MPQESTSDAAAESDLLTLTIAGKPTIKILLYTDAPFNVVKAPVGDFGLGRMIALLKAHAPAFADLCVKLESRYPPGSTHAENRIHVVLRREEEETGEPFDQVWFFGLHQVNKKIFNPRLRGGGPESELNTDEVNALRAWMDKGGGVLMTGDHADEPPPDAFPPDPNSPCPDPRKPETFLGLGRALGRCVPRAGEMRDWDGPPTSREEDSNDTQTTPFIRCGEPFPAQILFQRDRIPQQLILPTFNEKGESVAGGQPHPLFFYREGCGSIQFFPDHIHEGQVVIPKTSDETLWRRNDVSGFQPQPRVVAYGIDKRNGHRIDLVAAYDGSAVGVGRIVADSTWHHYFNINLSGFTQPIGPGSPIDQIGQFYGNLALWLSPVAKRFKMAEAMFRWLAPEPLVLEELVPRPKASVDEKLRAGDMARELLARVSSPCEIHELLLMTISGYYGYVKPFETLYLPEKGYNLSSLPSKQLLLGCVINWYPQELLDDVGAALASAERYEKVRAAFTIGVEEAFVEQGEKVLETALLTQKFLDEARLRASNLSKERTERGVEASSIIEQSSERSDAMTVCEIDSWDMTLIKDDLSSEERFSFRNIRVSGGILTGVVVDPGGPDIPLSGTCTQFVGTTPAQNIALMSFQFTVLGNGGIPVGIFMGGFGSNDPSDRGVFTGRYSAFAVPAELAREIRLAAAVDPGDTGTGNGNQT